MERGNRGDHLNFPQELQVQKITMAGKIPVRTMILQNEVDASVWGLCKVEIPVSYLCAAARLSSLLRPALQSTARAPPTKVWLYLGVMLIRVPFIRWGYERHLSRAITNESFTMSSLREAEGQLLVWQCIELTSSLSLRSLHLFVNTTWHLALENLERLFAVSLKLLTENGKLIKASLLFWVVGWVLILMLECSISKKFQVEKGPLRARTKPSSRKLDSNLWY